MATERKEFLAQRKDVFRWVHEYGMFGWKYDETLETAKDGTKVTVRMSRPQNLVNRTELVRLESQFESCRKEIEKYEESITRAGMLIPLSLGVTGMALVIAGLLAHGWPRAALLAVSAPLVIMPAPLSRRLGARRTAELAPFITQKQDEIRGIGIKAARLLNESF